MLLMEHITKTFPGVVANDDVTLEVAEGEVHALLGENGAGKTTIMNILYGLYRPDAGRIMLKGQPAEIHSTRAAIQHGIGMVHQHFMLVPTMTVVQNVILGLKSAGFVLDLKRARQEVARLSQSYGLDVDPAAPISGLSVGKQQRVEIVKALYRGADLLIMDEPTAVLIPQEVRELISILRGLAADGKSVIFISHKLDEVMEVSDRVTVLRDGCKVATVKTSETNKAELARMMVGRDVVFRVEKPAVEPGEIVLDVQGLCADDDRGLPALRSLSFSIRRGEILGVAGVDGNGQSELAEALTGLRQPTAGEVRLSGRDVSNCGPRELHRLKVGHVPEDRQKVGLVLTFSVAENLLVKDFDRPPFARKGFLNTAAFDGHARDLIQEYSVRCPSTQTPARLLSGGNQQKVVLAREIFNQPDLLVAVQPTRGLDVGATEYVEGRLLEERARGAAILYISTELDEIMALSDRIAVLYNGEIMGILNADKATVETVGSLMAGVRGAAA